MRPSYRAPSEYSLPYLVLAHRYLIISLDFVIFHQFISLDYFFLYYQSPHLRHEMFYWTRQTKNSLAEITFQFASIIAPIISCFSRN